MDTYTLVSIYPQVINETKPGQDPAEYCLKACEDEKVPSTLHIGEAVDNRFVGGDVGTVQMPIKAETVAKAFVQDLISSFAHADASAYPGVFYLEGKKTIAEILASAAYKEALGKQRAYFLRLVKLADDDWNANRKHGNISAMHRLAANKLGQVRDWTVNVEDSKTLRCPGCMVHVPEQAVICANCKTILDEEKFKKLKIAS